MDSYFQALYTMPLAQTAAWALLGNVAMFCVALAVGELLVRRYRHKANSPAALPLSIEEMSLAAVCVILNALVAVVGLALWRAGILVLRPDGVWWDVSVLIALMDFGMYVFHRIAHHPLLYPIVHRTHHRYENPRPLTLFVLNPFEVLGFGALLIAVIWISHASRNGILIYLAFNLLFGLIGHLGVEPAPPAWVRMPVLRTISTSTFHAEHHHDRDHNFGFYTVIWDKLFRTLSPQYVADFQRANRN